jgi:hypothetical protein
MKDIKITASNARTFKANIAYLLDRIAIRTIDGWELKTLDNELLNVHAPECDYGCYSVTSRFVGIYPATCPLNRYTPQNGKCNWLIKETNDPFAGWLTPFEEISKDLSLLITGEGDITKAIAAKGRLEDFLPEKGHLILYPIDGTGSVKMTVAAFRKKYAVALGTQCWLSFSSAIHLDRVPYSPLEKWNQTMFVYPQG